MSSTDAPAAKFGACDPIESVFLFNGIGTRPTAGSQLFLETALLAQQCRDGVHRGEWQSEQGQVNGAQQDVRYVNWFWKVRDGESGHTLSLG